MSGTQKLIGWALFAVLVVVLVMASKPDHGRPEGYSGSYLGRTVDGQQAFSKQVDELNARATVQRF